jgi:hypothetical protein
MARIVIVCIRGGDPRGPPFARRHSSKEGAVGNSFLNPHSGAQPAVIRVKKEGGSTRRDVIRVA